VNAVTITGTAVKSSKNKPRPFTSGNSLGLSVLPWMNALIAMPMQMATNTTAKRTDTAEENLKDSVSRKLNKNAVSAHSCSHKKFKMVSLN